MTPDEIRIALRLFNERVYWGGFRVGYTLEHGYHFKHKALVPVSEDGVVVKIFDENGRFAKVPEHWAIFGEYFQSDEFTTKPW